MGVFNLGPKIYMGPGTLVAVLNGLKRFFIVTDEFMRASKKVRYITEAVDEVGGDSLIFSGVKPDPDTHIIAAGVKEAVSFRPDCIVAFGGGSVIDVAKAIRFFGKERIGDCFLAIIPTTSGTGSEVSNYSVITDAEKMVKYPLTSDLLLPDAAILDASLVMSVPPSVTADTGIDVLTHAVEAFVSKGHTDFSDAMAEKAIKLVCSNLHTVYLKPDDYDARQAMHNASCMAGVAFSNAGLGLNHAMAHALGAVFHIPHGRANGILLPYVMMFNAGCTTKLTPAAERYAQIASFLDLDTSALRPAALSVIRSIRSLIGKINIPTSIGAAGIGRDEFEAKLGRLADAAMEDACRASNPTDSKREDILHIYRGAFCGRYLV